MNTAALELKINAVQIIRDLVYHSGKHFNQFVPKTAELIKGLINYQYSYAIRKASLKAVDSLLVCCDGNEQMQSLLLQMLPEITQLLDKKLDKLMFKELRMIMKQTQSIFK